MCSVFHETAFSATLSLELRRRRTEIMAVRVDSARVTDPIYFSRQNLSIPPKQYIPDFYVWIICQVWLTLNTSPLWTLYSKILEIIWDLLGPPTFRLKRMLDVWSTLLADYSYSGWNRPLRNIELGFVYSFVRKKRTLLLWYSNQAANSLSSFSVQSICITKMQFLLRKDDSLACIRNMNQMY